MKYLKYNTALLLYILLLSVFSCGGKDNSIKVTNWKILQYHTDSYKEISSRNGWRPAKIPSTILESESERGKFKFVWLKGEFNIEGAPSFYYGISTGRVKYSDAIYINDHFIDSQQPRKINWVPGTRHYPIPEGVLKKGPNTVFIQLGIYDKYNGGIMDDVLIQPESDFEMTKFISNLIFRQLPFGIVVLFAGLAISLFITYIWDRREKVFLFSSFPVLTGMIYIAVPFFPNSIVSYEFYSAIQYSLAPVFSILLILLTQSIYRIYLSNYNRVILPLLALLIIIVIITRGESYDIALGIGIIILTLLIAIPFFIYMMYQLYSVNEDKFILFIASSIFFVAMFIIIFEIYLEITGGRSGELIATYTPLTFVVLGTIVTSREIKKRKNELETVYDKLKKLESKEVAITDNLEEKLNRVIAFMDENYTSDLSREGLAAAVGIHPNYFGRLFKTYTGKTINDYINSLRIDDAIRQLSREDVKIIDIAFAVGFESLVTFNRVFKKVVSKTPSEYRDDK